LFAIAYLKFLFKIIKAAKVPGIHPAAVNKVTITIEPHPWSITANGGNNKQSKTLKQDISLLYL
jgi:hypothetical protein